MDESTAQQLLLLTISLSATVQLIRRRFLDKKIKDKRLKALLLADIPLVIGGIILLAVVNINFFKNHYENFYLAIPVLCIDIGIFVLVGFIFNTWIITCTQKNDSSSTKKPSAEFIKDVWVLYEKEIDKQKKTKDE